MIENRAETAAYLTEQLVKNRYVGRFRSVSAPESTAMIDRVLEHYDKWSRGNQHELTACLDFLENICLVLSIPLAETAYALYVLRDGIDALLCAEAEGQNGETMRQVNRFFEELVRELLRRY